jgi:hypothetical protein
LGKNVPFNDGVPENFDNAHGRPCLVILDDLLNDVYSQQVCNLFTKGSHHRYIGVILITQNVFHPGRYCRDFSLNAKYIIVLKNERDKKQFRQLARQVYPENGNSLHDAYLEGTEKSHGYLVLDLAQDTDLLRFRTNIFPEDRTPPIVYANIEDGTSEIELPRSSCSTKSPPKTAKSDRLALRQRTR